MKASRHLSSCWRTNFRPALDVALLIIFALQAKTTLIGGQFVGVVMLSMSAMQSAILRSGWSGMLQIAPWSPRHTP
jgi:hypothetical protein